MNRNNLKRLTDKPAAPGDIKVQFCGDQYIKYRRVTKLYDHTVETDRYVRLEDIQKIYLFGGSDEK